MPVYDKEDNPFPMVTTTVRFYIDTGPTPGVTRTESTYGYGSRYTVKVGRSWVRTPDYSSLKAAGTLPDNPFTFERNLMSNGGNVMFYRFDRHDEFSATQEIHMMSTLLFQGYQQFDKTLTRVGVLTKLLAQARSNQWNVPVFIAELGKTSEMVYERATQLVGLVRDLKRGDFASFVKGLHPSARYGKRKTEKYEKLFRKQHEDSPRQAAASALLEYQYGWVPFMLDIQSAVNTLVDMTEEAREGRDRGLLTVRAYDSVLDASTGLRDLGVFPDVGATSVDNKKQSYKAVWTFSVNPADVPSRLGLINLLEVGWELTTLSFVVDWAIPIGDYLAGFGDKYRFNHVGGTIGYKAVWAQTLYNWTSTDYSRVNGPAQTRVSTWGERRPLDGVPEITLRDLWESAQVGFSVKRAVTSMALLSSTFDSLKRR